MKKLLTISFVLFIAFFTACFDSESDKDGTLKDGTLTVNGSGFSEGDAIGFQVYPAGTTLNQIGLGTATIQAGGYFIVDASGSGSLVAADSAGNPVTLTAGTHVLIAGHDSNHNGHPDDGEPYVLKDITINGNTTVNLIANEFKVVMWYSIIGSWGLTYLEDAPSVNSSNSVWNIEANGNYDWFLYIGPYDLSGTGTYTIDGNRLCVTGILADDISGSCIEITPEDGIDSFSFLDDDGDKWTYERITN